MLIIVSWRFFIWAVSVSEEESELRMTNKLSARELRKLLRIGTKASELIMKVEKVCW